MCVSVFLSSANPNLRENPRFGGATPFAIAVDAGHLEVADCLAEAGGDVNVQSTLDGSTPLHRAARRGDSTMVRSSDTMVCQQRPHSHL